MDEELENPNEEALLEDAPKAPEQDSADRFKEYLRAQQAVNMRHQSPEYQQGLGESRDRMENVKGDANFGALLFDSAAKMGMAGGKQVQSDYGRFAQNLRGDLDKYQSDQEQMRAGTGQEEDRGIKLQQYLAAQQAKEQAQKIQTYQALTQRKKLSQPENQVYTDENSGTQYLIDKKSGKRTEIGAVGKKPQADGKNQLYTDDVTGKQYLVNTTTGERKLVGDVGKKPISDTGAKLANELNTEWDKHPTTKGTRDVQTAYSKILNADETATGDMSLIYGFMKMQDPGSTVREGEYASAENARGVESTILNLYNKLRSGERLTPQQRAAFKTSAGNIYKSQLATQKQTDAYLKQRAEKAGLGPESLVMTDFEKETPTGLAPSNIVSGQAGAAPSSAAGKGAKVKVSNGTETLMIDPGDEQDAATDGFRRVP